MWVQNRNSVGMYIALYLQLTGVLAVGQTDSMEALAAVGDGNVVVSQTEVTSPPAVEAESLQGVATPLESFEAPASEAIYGSANTPYLRQPVCEGYRGSLCGCSCDCRCSLTWSQVELLLWKLTGYSTPAMITRSPGGTPQTEAGVLGQGATEVVLGNEKMGDNLLVGGRVQIGKWRDPSRRFGWQFDFFGLKGSDSVTFTSSGSEVFARPFFNTDPAVNKPGSQIFSMPGLADGSVRVETTSKLISSSPALRWNLHCCEATGCVGTGSSSRLDFLMGYRFVSLDEQFASQENLGANGSQFVTGTRYVLDDRIEVENNFHGLEFGLDHLDRRNRWTWNLTTSVALGQMRRVVDLNGSTTFQVPGVADTVIPGGFFVGGADVGRWKSDDFAVTSQVRANVSYDLGHNWRLGAGYNFMFIGSVYRPNSFLNTGFDGRRLAALVPAGSLAQRPSAAEQRAFFHGANLSMSYRF